LIETLKVKLQSYAPETQSNLRATLIPASVIVLITYASPTYKILLNKRTNNVQDHKGEISFPGGRKDNSDVNLQSTALREFEEEMGISPDNIDIIGRLSDVATSTNYLITPYVATTNSKLNLSPNPKEVESIIEIPIHELNKHENVRTEVRVNNLKPNKYSCYAYQGKFIWGATARILTELLTMIELELH
tara:strand:+ start:6140 stop:6709 length:570 start_codon:yes stop_codon:yes gene_type:complete